MKKNTSNQPEHIITNPLMRRTFLKATTLLGLGTMASGTVKSYANVSEKNQKALVLS
jgi:uncharacterized protein (DUF1501 family)